MSRGNQRELARKRNAKKDASTNKDKKKGGDPKKRMENDASILRAKQKAADERKAQETADKAKSRK
ncbi:hypothetical protein FOA43_001631 [Brettanomyces nanus]|uniref:Small EDRK-rich factor-like N-terminal domain-containing protein n=1 Tax=Eeniella nana TaxID=13502 RepID=A0A875S1U9_EENNA|nr:uncharacterized protein FOA43_001631 [Brettanomyces nanus]QPG74305.1 hypothetical protein FOA43_001631 [Brettanomyces nanus]